MTFREEVATLKTLHRQHGSFNADLANALWRFADAHAPVGWQNTCTSVLALYGYARQLLTHSKLILAHRALASTRMMSLYRPQYPDRWICRAKRHDLETLLKLTKDLFGTHAMLWQRGVLNAAYPQICKVSQADKDKLAHLGVMPLVRIAELRG